MKKRNLFTMGLLGASLIFMSSCNEDEGDPAVLAPTMSVEEVNSGSTGGDLTITQGDNLIFAWDARKGDNDLETFTVSTAGANPVSPIPNSYAGHTFPYDIENADDEIYIDTLAFTSASLNTGMTLYTFTVEDKLGTSRTITFDVNVEAATTPLSTPMDFTWNRVGGGDGTGLDQFGLAWLSNTSTSAIVTLDAATKMVMLDAGDWVSITTQEGLAAAVDAGTEIAEYSGVSVEQDDTYNDVLGVNNNGTYYILNVLTGDVESGTGGTEVTITGQYKN